MINRNVIFFLGFLVFIVVGFQNCSGGFNKGNSLSQNQAAGLSSSSSSSSSTSMDMVVSFSLIDAGTGQPISGYQTLSNGASINLQNLPTTALSLRANTNPSIVGSVEFVLDGSYNHIENTAPYSLCGDSTTSYTACAQLDTTGMHKLVATAFAGANATGTGGASYTISFSIVSASSSSSSSSSAKSSSSSSSAASSAKSSSSSSSNSSNSTGGCVGNVTVWAYNNGIEPNWADFDNGASTDYQDKSGGPVNGTYDAKTTITAQFGEWIYHAPQIAPATSATTPQFGVNITGCNFMYISLKEGPTPPGWTMYAVLDWPNDTPAGGPGVTIANMSGVATGNGWTEYKIPLYPSINGVKYSNYFYPNPNQTLLPNGTNTFYKFGLQDHSGTSSNYWYASQVYFTAQ